MSYQNATVNSIDHTNPLSSKGRDYKLRSLQDGVEYPLALEDMLVGREIECQVSLDSAHISRYHAKLTVNDKGIFVEDLRSTNGTYINGRRITAQEKVSLGDELRFHEIAFRLVVDDDESGLADQTAFQESSPSLRALALPKRAMDEPDDENTRLLSSNDIDKLRQKSKKADSSIDQGCGPRMVMMTAPMRGKVFSMLAREKSTWSIGRSHDCDIHLLDQTISNVHAKIRRLDEGWILEACEGLNPIFQNDVQVDFCSIKHSDIIRIGRLELVFRTDEKPLNIEQRKSKSVPWAYLMLFFGAISALGVALGVYYS